MLFDSVQKLYACPYCCKKNFKKKGFYYRRSARSYIPRYLCLECKKQFSTRTKSLTFRQKRADLNYKIFLDLTSGVSMRETARKNLCHYKTVYRKFLWLSKNIMKLHSEKTFFIRELQFDEMESIEHTKLKPLTIALAVDENYQILGVKVGKIPAKGKLSEISVKKYGFRPNESEMTLRRMFQDLKIISQSPKLLIKSDQKPSYKKIVQENFKSFVYQTHNAGLQKEKRREAKYSSLEKKLFDPIFALNQRMAKIRDHVKRFARRSWCTTKIPENLESHIYLYIAKNNGYFKTV